MPLPATERGRARPRDLAVPAAAAVGGILWALYGVGEMLSPWGVDVVHDEARGYDVVVDRGLFVLYSLPGALALLLCSAALLGLLSALRAPGRVTLIGGRAALALGAVSIVGVVVGVDPLFTGARVLGTLVLGMAAAGAAWRASAHRPRQWSVHLAVVAVLTIALFPLWPVVHALAWLTPAAGAAVIGAAGVAWATAGLRLLRGA